MKFRSLRRLGVILAGALALNVTAAPGTETYKYDARGRLASIKYPDGSQLGYTYDAVGNRVNSGKPAPVVGQFSLIGGYIPSQSQQTGYVDIKNIGPQGISGISAVCTGANWPITSAPAAIAAGAIVRYQFLVLAPGGNPCKLKLSVTNGSADNSPFIELTY